MIALLSRRAVRALDADASERLGVPTVVLMENAGHGAFETVRRRYANALSNVVIVGGPGQNGGDGWVLARHLLSAGFAPRAYLVGTHAELAGDALLNFDALVRLGATCVEVPGDDLRELDGALYQASLVVDALFGTGLNRPLTGHYAAVVERINSCRAPVVALDLPSGVDADTGAVQGVAVRAASTVTFAAHKRGLHQYPGAALAGAVQCVSIGVPSPSTADVELIERCDVATWLAPRAADAHKGSAGHVLAIAGGLGRTGAALLCGLGALRAGAGLCTIATDPETRRALEHKVIELMTEELPTERTAARAVELSAGKQSAVIGPGLGLGHAARDLARELAVSLPIPAVLDADALTALGRDYAFLREAGGTRVLTPHPGEASRLLGISSGEVQQDRYAAAKRMAEQSGAVVVLKGANTVIADPSGKLRVSPSGGPAMAVAGTGDVLSGVIAALLGQLEAFDAACAATMLHGLAGELAAEGDRGLLASELAARLPTAIARCLATT